MVRRRRCLQLFHVLVAVFLLYMKLSLGLKSGDDHMRCIKSERHALIKFKQGLIDDFGRLSSWGNEEDKRDCCKWRGVHCSNRTGHVTVLDLRGPWFNSNFGSKPLKGKLNPSLLELQHLNYLDLSFNDFGARPIPGFFGSLRTLRYLNLSQAEFGGDIPHQLGNLSNLWSLDLSSSFSYYDVKNLNWLSNLQSLRHLDLSGVSLGKVANWVQVISKLPLLVTLKLHESKFPNIIPSALPSINRSTSLAVIDISTNSLTSSIYYWLFNCSSSLVDINLAGNELEGVIPNAFGNIISLENLDLSLNQLEGGIPKSFGNLSNLRSLDLSRNMFNESFPEFLQKLYGQAEKSLEILRLRENQFTGSLPDITKFSFLRELYLEYNQLNGSFPERFGHLSHLEVLVLYRNQMKGPLPDLTALPSLRELNLFENQLTGVIPSSLGQLSQLEFLDVSTNFFEGVMSEVHLSNSSKLQYLDLSFNSLSLEISSDWVPPFQLDVVRLAYCKLGPNFPNWLHNQNNFTELDISSAGISDTAPNWFWDLPTRLQYLNLSYNQIIGMMPNLSFNSTDVTIIDLCTNLLEGPIPLFPPNVSLLNLSKNKFSGTITFVCAINGGDLTYLDLSDNQLSGKLPDCWMHLDGLQVLNLANNNFSGKIPSSMGSLLVVMLNLRNNSLIGELPVTLKNSTYLAIIDLSDNRLTGKLPAWIGDSLPHLIVLSLRSNQFYGSIPSQICHLVNIQILDLSSNNISGIIPNCIKNFSSMADEKESSSPSITYGNYGRPPRDRDGLDDMYGNGVYVVSLLLIWKGRESEYKKTLGLVRSIDLSSNKLIGEIPTEITSLVTLVALNLSRNNLTGLIPPKIGQLRLLDFLDLSRNQLSGGIPGSLSELSFLGVLDLSNNFLFGRIPTSTKLQSFNASAYIGNPGLCGPPLTQACPGDGTPPNPNIIGGNGSVQSQENEDKFTTTGFYVSMGFGFVIGFWGACGTLILSNSWRYTFFQLLDSLKDWLYVTTAVNTARLKRQFQY